MIDTWLVAGVVLGGALAFTVERGRRARLHARIGRELDVLGAVLDRRRAQLLHLGVELPEALPACHGALELLGRAQRACGDALLDWHRRPEAAAVAEVLAVAEARWSAALHELRLEAPATPALERLLELGPAAAHRLEAARDALDHYLVRAGRTTPVRAG
jgi:hypothetical protein